MRLRFVVRLSDGARGPRIVLLVIRVILLKFFVQFAGRIQHMQFAGRIQHMQFAVFRP